MRHLLIFFALCVSACSLSSQPVPPTLTPIPTPLPPRAPSIVPSVVAGWATYTDPNIGFSLDYPASWYVLGGYSPDAISYAITFSELDPNTVPGRGGLDTETGKVDVYVHGGDLTVDELYSINTDPLNESTVLDEQAWALSDGTPAIYLHIRGRFEDEIHLLITTINGQPITIVSFGDAVLLEQIAASLRPAP